MALLPSMLAVQLMHVHLTPTMAAALASLGLCLGSLPALQCLSVDVSNGLQLYRLIVVVARLLENAAVSLLSSPASGFRCGRSLTNSHSWLHPGGAHLL